MLPWFQAAILWRIGPAKKQYILPDASCKAYDRGIWFPESAEIRNGSCSANTQRPGI